jgi:2-polyprenyl-3-methyl-5-hydroxy-6-metoxy-1,4-benzoquinol methylase
MTSESPHATPAPTAPDGKETTGRAPRLSAGVFSCVVDDHPRFHLDALRWFASLTVVAGVDPSQLVVYVVGSPDSDALDRLRVEGVAVHPVDAFDPRSPHCNKISGALRLAAEGVDGTAVLCDTDVAVLEDPRILELPNGSIAAKLVDAPVPPLAVLSDVFEAAGIALPPVVPLPWGPGDQTVSGNCNGGLYLVPAPMLAPVATAWERWARWLLERTGLLEQWNVHVDQVAMALAIAAEGIGFHSLEPRWNTPTHDLGRIPADAASPAIIHYHQELVADGSIRATGTASIDQQIERVNGAVGTLWQRAFPNATFWQWRYLTDPGLGSGVGSRGEPLRSKRDLLAAVLDSVRPESVLDVGCGDGEATRGLAMAHYTGIDLSPEAIRRAKAGRVDGEYLVGTVDEHQVEAELTLCLDVLIHQADLATYRALVARLWEVTRRVLVISGYERPHGMGAPMVHFHEPLSTTLRAVAPDAELYPVRDEHGITTICVLRPPTTRHERDYSSATLDPLIGRHPDPVGLMAIRLHAWQTIGFYPDHAPRLWEYPVVAGLLGDALEPQSRIIDIGAGVTPLVPYLGRAGYVVDTVDPSPVQRIWPPQPDWNEWDFLDYAAAGLAHRSWNCTLDQVPRDRQFDAAYSVSVIEHLCADDRRALIGEIAARVRTGGLVVFTIDLVRDGDDLWNRNRGIEVEEPSRHGTITDVVAEAEARGLELFQVDRVRNWGDSVVDIGLLAMVRASRPTSLGEVVRRGRMLGHRVVAAGRRLSSGS